MTKNELQVELNKAMMLLEMLCADELIVGVPHLLAISGHAIIQNINKSLMGLPPINENMINETLSIVWSACAIANAKNKE